jgi:hypothetical protein
MSKRRKIIFVSLILSLGLLFIQTKIVAHRYWAILGLSVLAYFLTAWALREGLNGVEWLAVLSLPVLFTAGVSLSYYLFPPQWLARFSIIGLYALGVYVLLLTENIFSVASIRSIQLLRSAQATGFLLTLVTAFFLFDTVFSFRLEPWLNFLIIFGISFFLFLQGLWSVTLEERISSKLLLFSLVLALVLAEMALAISFWPVSVATGSLFLITVLYLLLGLIQNSLLERLFKKTIREYLWVGLIVFLTIFLTTQWGS